MTEADQKLVALVINRLGAHELTDVLQIIFERLEKIEDEIFPPEKEADAGAEAEETVPPLEEGTPQAPVEEEQSSSTPPEPESAPTT